MKMEENMIKNYLKSYKIYYKPWVIDIWSLGCVILEIIYGIPLWLKNKIIIK